MKKIFLFMSLGLVAGLMVACGGSKKAEEATEEEVTVAITPQSTNIGGPFGKAYSVVDRKYKPQGEYSIKSLNVEVEVKEGAQFPEGFDPMKVGTSRDKGEAKYAYIADFTIEYLDADGDVIETKDVSDGLDRLLRANEGDKVTLSFYLPDNYEEIKSFRVVSDYYPNEVDASSSFIDMEEVEEETSSKKSKSSTVDEEFDKAMDQANKALETTTKVMKGVKELLN